MSHYLHILFDLFSSVTTSEVLSASLNELKLRRNRPSFTVDLVSFVLCNKTTLSFYFLLLFLLDNGKSHILSCGVFTHSEVVLNRFSMLIVVLVVILPVGLCVGCGWGVRRGGGSIKLLTTVLTHHLL